MTKNVLASYEPDLMVIKINKDFKPLSNEDGKIIPFKSLEEISIFFHEWIHFIHNSSTLIGLTLFNSYIGLWKIFRFTYADGQPVEVELDEDLKIQLKNLIEFKNAIRLGSKEQRLNNKKNKDISISETELFTQGNSEFKYSFIKSKVLIQHKDGYVDTIDVDIKTHEILENCAFLLEKKIALGELDEACLDDGSTQILPYRIVELFIESRISELSFNEKICCMIASLQSPNPPEALDNILTLIIDSKSSKEIKDMQVIDIVKLWSDSQIKNNKIFITKFSQYIEDSFPVDEPIGNAIKYVVKTFIQNISFREEDAFFELKIIDECRNDILKFDEAIRQYKGCTIIKENSGDKDKIQKDIMYSLTHSAQTEDWQVFYSAIHFIKAHMMADGSKRTPTISAKCPFYTICPLDLRKNEPDICANTPWEAEKLGNGKELCWYAWGVRQTRPQI